MSANRKPTLTHFTRGFVAFSLFIYSSFVFAGQSEVRVPLKESESSPAIDLYDPETLEPLDRDVLTDLILSGQNTQKFEPQKSNLYSGKNIPSTYYPNLPYPEDGATVIFKNELAHASGLVRAKIFNPGNSDVHFQLMFSLDSHASLS